MKFSFWVCRLGKALSKIMYLLVDTHTNGMPWVYQHKNATQIASVSTYIHTLERIQTKCKYVYCLFYFSQLIIDTQNSSLILQHNNTQHTKPHEKLNSCNLMENMVLTILFLFYIVVNNFRLKVHFIVLHVEKHNRNDVAWIKEKRKF